MANSVGGVAFAKRMEKIALQIEKNTEKMMHKAALAADQALVTGTPVLTGTARVNWQVSLGAAVTGTLPGPSTPEAGATEAIEQGREAALQWKVGKGGIFIANNLPYIVPLNNGSSAQAPEGMTEDALLAAEEVVKNTRLMKGT